MIDQMRAFILEGSPDSVTGRIGEFPTAGLPDGDVTIRVSYSSINYKDAMIAAGQGRMVRRFPHIPGVDLVGRVEADRSGRFQPGEAVIVTSYGLGVSWFGGYAQLARVPADWPVRLPPGLTEWGAMAVGSAGFTSMLALLALERNGLRPDQGPVVVTGATGGVGCIAVELLAHAGYTVAASSGKADQREFLTRLGASRTLSREEVTDPSPKALLAETWAGAVDNVGGETLAYLLRSMRIGGSVALTGLVHGSAFSATVFPFILRGVNLLGIDSVNCPKPLREEAWARLAGPAKPRHLEEIGRTIGLEELPEKLREILSGGARGRYVVKLPA